MGEGEVISERGDSANKRLSEKKIRDGEIDLGYQHCVILFIQSNLSTFDM